MPTSKTNICNLALGHLGVAREIANIDTENSKEAQACRRFFNIVRDMILRDFNWPFARKVVALDLIQENPSSKWCFSYRYPTDAVRLIRICPITENVSTYQNYESEEFYRIPFEIARDGNARAIWTNLDSPELEYISDVDDVSDLPPDFQLAFSYLLAGHIAPRVTGGDPFSTGSRSYQLYAQILEKAKANASNEIEQGRERESEFITVREGYEHHDERYWYKRGRET